MASSTKQPIDPERAEENVTARILAIVTVSYALAMITASLRFYTRAVLVSSFGKDDVVMALAVLCSLVGLVTWIIGCQHGDGRHQETIDAESYAITLIMQYIQSVVTATFGFLFLKISIAMSLLRLSTGNWYRWILWGLSAFVCLYSALAFISFMTFCRPIAGMWDSNIPHHCYSKELYRNFGLFNAACNILTDVAFATLPIPIIWSLQMQRRTRIVLICILSGGYFAVALGIAKAVFIIAFVHEKDGTYEPWAPFFGYLQLNMGIIAACAPMLRPLLGRALRLSAKSTYKPYKDPNYYRAGKALDRMPRSGPNSARGYLKQNTNSGQFEVGDPRWSPVTAPRHDARGGLDLLAETDIFATIRQNKAMEKKDEITDEIVIERADPEFKLEKGIGITAG
ncbi:hypothetical protein QBC46DRAFT_268605 [Diplogelasinospora grovesii]|uniref:Rhodopsin domain-containing protein n=1 Tax=Diplogelasinospora grovesii TaxID=303347 RepID=A0AAN6S210_9PEZI|nr:hypothetical protein QBC46DRAFT_268605 [Diplogelasinospora grovesii]